VEREDEESTECLDTDACLSLRLGIAMEDDMVSCVTVTGTETGS